MTSKEWKNYKFSELVYILGGGTPKTTVSEYWNGTIPWLSVKDFNSGEKFVYTTEKTITQLGLEKSSTQLLKKNDIILSARGTVGEIAVIPFLMAFNQSCYGIRAKEEIINSDFLYYLLKNSINLLKHNTHGSVFDTITRETFDNIEIKLPPLKNQQKIAKVLSVIDDKIELNNSINNNLEQQAQAIFKENISKNCNNSKNGCIGDYCAIKSGFAFKGSWWRNTGIKVIKIKTIDNDNINFNDCSYVSEDKIQYAKDFIVKGGDLLIAMTGATIGKFAIVPKVNETILVNQRVGKFFLGENPVQNLPFLYCTLKKQDVINEIINKGQGSAQPNISGSDIMNTLCYFPEKQNIVDFNNLCTPIFEKIINNKYENYHLIKLRDTLLPKLMSGEIDVSDVDIFTDKLYEPANESKLSAEPYNSSGSFASASKNLPSEQSSSADKLLFSEEK